MAKRRRRVRSFEVVLRPKPRPKEPQERLSVLAQAVLKDGVELRETLRITRRQT